MILGIIVASVASMIIGALWYGPMFGKLWMNEAGISDKKLKESQDKGMGLPYALNFITVIITVWVLSFLMNLTGLLLPFEAMQLGFYVWLGFYLTMGIGHMIWMDHSFKFLLINQSYNLVYLLVSTALLAAL